MVKQVWNYWSSIWSLSAFGILPIFCERDFNFEVVASLLFCEPGGLLNERWKDVYSSRQALEAVHMLCLTATEFGLST